MLKTRLQTTVATLRAWGAGVRDYLASASPFPPIDPPTIEPPVPPAQPATTEEAPISIVMVGGPFHLETFMLRPCSPHASLVLTRPNQHTGSATYLRRAGDLDALGRERWYFDRPTSTAGDA